MPDTPTTKLAPAELAKRNRLGQNPLITPARSTQAFRSFVGLLYVVEDQLLHQIICNSWLCQIQPCSAVSCKQPRDAGGVF